MLLLPTPLAGLLLLWEVVGAAWGLPLAEDHNLQDRCQTGLALDSRASGQAPPFGAAVGLVLIG